MTLNSLPTIVETLQYKINRLTPLPQTSTVCSPLKPLANKMASKVFYSQRPLLEKAVPLSMSYNWKGTSLDDGVRWATWSRETVNRWQTEDRRGHREMQGKRECLRSVSPGSPRALHWITMVPSARWLYSSFFPSSIQPVFSPNHALSFCTFPPPLSLWWTASTCYVFYVLSPTSGCIFHPVSGWFVYI